MTRCNYGYNNYPLLVKLIKIKLNSILYQIVMILVLRSFLDNENVMIMTIILKSCAIIIGLNFTSCTF